MVSTHGCVVSTQHLFIYKPAFLSVVFLRLVIYRCALKDFDVHNCILESTLILYNRINHHLSAPKPSLIVQCQFINMH